MDTMTPQFKREYSKRLTREYYFDIDPKLRAVLYDLGVYMVMSDINKSVVITCLLRTATENADVGGRPDSSHVHSRGADIRTRSLTQKQIEDILEYVNTVWGVNMVHIIYHKGGTAPHIHLNINRAYATKIPV